MVDHEKLAAVLAEFARTLLTEFPIQAILDHLADRIVEVLPITGAGVTLIAGDKDPHYISASSSDALRYEQLQSEVGEGPCIAAYESGLAVVVPDLEHDAQFPRFAPQAVAEGLRAVFTLPLRHDDGCLGALDLYRTTPGGLDEEELAVAQTLADVATAYLLNTRAREEARASGDRFHHSSLHDPLTSLPNRRLLQERIEQAAQRARRSHSTAAVLFADLDRFKVVNDTYGHQAGDVLLVAVARRLASLVRSGDTLARVSGDEFVFLCEDLKDEHDAELLASRINDVFAEPFALDGTGQTVAMTASVGIAYAGPGEDISDQLVVEADMAMYQVKRRGGGGHQVIDMREALRTMDVHGLERDLRAALTRDELQVVYQPIVRANDGSMVGVEALLRWAHPLRGAIPPPTIIRIAEQSGTIGDLGAWVLERSCRDRARWAVEHPDLLQDLAVNVSAQQLLDPDFHNRVSDVLDRTGMDPASLVLEVTESIFIEDDGAARRVLSELDALGIRLALDDFGTGYSSLSYLCRLPIHIVKIDRCFISDLDHAPTRAIVVAITGLARDLGLDVIAEGIETDGQADQVNELGCQFAQGFLFDRPMSAEAITTRLETTSARNPDMDRPATPPPVPSSSSRPERLSSGRDRPATKRTLSVLSHALEELAFEAGSAATVVATFQHGPYFAPMATRYERLAASGATVVVAHAGPGPAAEGVHRVAFENDDPLGHEWSMLLITPDMAAHVIATDLVDFDPTEINLEHGRRFSSRWGFDRLETASHLERLVGALDLGARPDLLQHMEVSIAQARRQPQSRTERGLGAAAQVLISRLEVNQRTLSDLRASLAVETELATTDPLTGLLNRKGMDRWLGGSDLAGLAMPSLGMIMIDLDDFKAINDRHGRLAGDEILVAVARTLLSSTRPGDVVTRWGGDEFIVLCPGIAGAPLARMAERLLDAIAEVQVGEVSVTGSAGLQVSDRRPLVLATLDDALYAAKTDRRG